MLAYQMLAEVVYEFVCLFVCLFVISEVLQANKTVPDQIRGAV